jgi:5-methylcytosine-specific restriction endonuclease McrA
LNYKEYLKSDHWVKTKNLALQRSGNKCQLCSSKTKLNVHHNNYKNLGKEKETDLIVLCKLCHQKFHNKNVTIKFKDVPYAKEIGLIIEKIKITNDGSAIKLLLKEVDNFNKLKAIRTLQ